MLAILTAFQAEATPIIKKFNLKKESAHPVPIFLNENIVLGISGLGKLNMAVATSYIGVLFKPLALINLGIGGHPHQTLGSCHLAGKIREAHSNQVFYPVHIVPSSFSIKEILTVDTPEKNYAEDAIYEMEAYGFFKAASLFATAEFIHVIKVISDSRQAALSQVTPGFATELITNVSDEIISYAQQLLKKAEERVFPEGSIDLFLDRYFFSSTEKVLLKDLLRRHKLLSKEPFDFQDCRNGKELLAKLRHTIQNKQIKVN